MHGHDLEKSFVSVFDFGGVANGQFTKHVEYGSAFGSRALGHSVEASFFSWGEFAGTVGRVQSD